ncbi:hypothetical protein SLS64_006261 [Diaporthe eres]|uniref:Ecp2 effector protein domain-containing protein n=1 Tax=Diaporthe eres TaxID=83184 RepID=A0ABR1NW15_DIAER
MNTADLLTFLALAFQFLLGLTSASPISSLSAVARSLGTNSWSPLAAVARRDEDHLCSASTDLVYEYGNQSHPDDLISDCQTLSEKFKNITDEQGNITQSCGSPPPPSKRATRGFNLLGSQGNCSLWLNCLGNDSQNDVTLDYGDIADVIQLATDGLGTASDPKNSSIVSVRASTECQSLQTIWVVALNSSQSAPGIGPQDGDSTAQLQKITSNFSPAGELQQ